MCTNLFIAGRAKTFHIHARFHTAVDNILIPTPKAFIDKKFVDLSTEIAAALILFLFIDLKNHKNQKPEPANGEDFQALVKEKTWGKGALALVENRSSKSATDWGEVTFFA